MQHVTRSQSLRPLPLRAEASTANRGRAGLTLVEMLVAMAITLLIMAAVVTVFANVTSSVTNRRATIEMASALRNVRDTLARDLAGATCPAVPWQRPESNHGYLEIIEGPQNDYYPSPWLYCADVTAQTLNGYPIAEENADGSITEPIGNVPGIDLAISSLPGSNLGGDPIDDVEGRGLAIGVNAALPEKTATDGRGLGDADDILMLTVRNEDEPFAGRIPNPHDPANDLFGPSSPGVSFAVWGGQHQEVESQLAEVVWYAVENPVDPNRTFAFGEPGYRTIYRRALLILPELNYEIRVTAGGIGRTGVSTGPGVVRVLPPGIGRGNVAAALAGLIAFQEIYDLSVRLEWDATLPGSNDGRWVLKANTLSDLTRRENRYEHHGFVPRQESLALLQGSTIAADRYFPFMAANGGIHDNSATPSLVFFADTELDDLPNYDPASGFQARIGAGTTFVVSHETSDPPDLGRYDARPLVVVDDPSDSPATVRAILNETGQVVHITTGLAPLGGSRRGDDIMMTDALGFDLRVYDPGAPLYSYVLDGIAEQVVQPGDVSWPSAFYADTNGTANRLGDGTAVFPFVGQGAYVDLAYGRSFIRPNLNPPSIGSRYNRFELGNTNDKQNDFESADRFGLVRPRFYEDGQVRYGSSAAARTQRYATFDTWSTHYESNGVNEDGDNLNGNLRTDPAQQPMIDEGVNGLDDPALYHDDTNNDLRPDNFVTVERFGPDDDAERETRPPYDTALRGMQVTLRVYERDSRQIREVRVRESFVPE